MHFVLQLGYFKAKRQFFVYACNEVQEDLRHILERHFPGRALATIRETRLGQQQVILNLFNYKRCGKAAKQDLERKAGRIAMRSTQPVYIVREVLQRGLPVSCFDGDPLNQTLGGFASLDVKKVDFLENTEKGRRINPRRFDDLVEQIANQPAGSHIIVGIRSLGALFRGSNWAILE